MSVDYQAVTARDEALLDGGEGGRAIDVRGLVVKIQAAIPGFEGDTRGEVVELEWMDDEESGYIQVYVTPGSVGVSHGFGGGDELMEVLMDLFSVLDEAGLHVWDPQNGNWLGD